MAALGRRFAHVVIVCMFHLLGMSPHLLLVARRPGSHSADR